MFSLRLARRTRDGSRKACFGRTPRLFVELLEARHLLSTVSWDGGAGTANWHDALNWSTDTVPTAADHAIIGDLTGTPTIIVSTSTSVGSLESQEAISFKAGTFTVGSTATVNANVIIEGGTLSGGIWTFTSGAMKATANDANRLTGVAVNGELQLSDFAARVKLEGARPSRRRG